MLYTFLNICFFYLRMTKVKCIINSMKCPNTVLFWSVFSCIRTENSKIRSRNNSIFGHFSCSDYYIKVAQVLITIQKDDLVMKSPSLQRSDTF